MMTYPIGTVPWVWENYIENKISFSRIKTLLDEEEIDKSHLF